MPRRCARHRRRPRAGIDRFDRPEPALAIIATVIGRPARAETIALLLDRRRRGRAVLVVAGTDDPDAVVEVAERISEADDVGAVVMASVRPDGAGLPPDVAGRSDVDRWLEASDLLERAGIDLLEWYVVAADGVVTCPREVFGEPPRW